MSKTPKTPKEAAPAAAPAAVQEPDVIAPGRPATPAEIQRWKFVQDKIARALSVADDGIARRKEALEFARAKGKPGDIARLERLVASDEAARAELRRFYDRKLEIVAAEIGGTPEETKDGWVVRS